MELTRLLLIPRLVDELVGDPSCDVFGIWGGQSQDDVLEAGEIRPDMEAYELMRGIGNLCIGADNDPRYDARHMVELLIAGLLQSSST